MEVVTPGRSALEVLVFAGYLIGPLGALAAAAIVGIRRYIARRNRGSSRITSMAVAASVALGVWVASAIVLRLAVEFVVNVAPDGGP